MVSSVTLITRAPWSAHFVLSEGHGQGNCENHISTRDIARMFFRQRKMHNHYQTPATLALTPLGYEWEQLYGGKHSY